MNSDDTDEQLIRIGDKFALLAVEVYATDVPEPLTEVIDGVWVTSKPPFEFSQHWREWLGSVRHDHYLTSSLFVLIKIKSANPSIFDEESQRLLMLGNRFLTCLTLVKRLRIDTDPLLVTGGRINQNIDLKQVITLYSQPILPGHRPERLSLRDLYDAGHLYESIKTLSATEGFLRLYRIMTTFSSALHELEALDQLHQFCRCIEGLIIPEPGKSTKWFQSRTQLFIGPQHHALMLSIYKNRSAVEHLNDHLLVMDSGRNERIKIIQQAIIAEFIARNCLLRIYGSPKLWPYFQTDNSLKEFWALPEPDRQALWGPPIDPLSVLREFNSNSIQNNKLGLS